MNPRPIPCQEHCWLQGVVSVGMALEDLIYFLLPLPAIQEPAFIPTCLYRTKNPDGISGAVSVFHWLELNAFGGQAAHVCV